jgi:dTDP-4-dehydrorhamnose reductase
VSDQPSGTLIIFGARGQLGRALCDEASRLGWQTITAARPETNITDRLAVDRVLAGVKNGIVVNAAAYTAVDKAEQEQQQAFDVNEVGAANVAAAAFVQGLPVVHISTDFVFDGTKSGEYTEADETNPLSVYGASKLAGEIAVAAANPRHVILRTAWVFSAHGSCFPRTIMGLLQSRDEISVVEDQIGCPTAAEHLSDIILTLAPRLIAQRPQSADFGLYHLGGLPVISRYDFACAIAREGQRQGFKIGRVLPRPTGPALTGAQRPLNSALSSKKFTEHFGINAPDWRKILPVCVRAYGEK